MNQMVKTRPEITGDFEVPGRPGPSMQDLLRADTRAVPEPLIDDSNDFAIAPGKPIPPARYISPEFHRLEVERMWSRAWQIACHEDQIQKVGDYVVYEIANKSIIVVRTAPDTIKAFYNACLHRGRTLCEKDGHASNFRCKFHGFMWRLDGSLGYVPSRWDFPDLKEAEMRLPETHVATWLGFVFINMASEPIPFEAFLGELPRHFKHWRFENRHITAHVGQVLRANWKIAAEAFLEFFHAPATHPQALPATSDTATRYGAIKGRHFGFMISPTAVPSASVAGRVSDQQVLDAIAQSKNNIEKGTYKLPEGRTPREHYADVTRAELRAQTGQEYAGVSDTEMVDLIVYTLYPNVTLFGGYGLPFWYRFRPWQNDPDMSLMEIFVMPEFAKDAPRPPAPTMTLLGPDQSFTDSPELQAMGLGAFFNQDLGNIAWVHKGLKTFARDSIHLSRYQESEIRQFHSWLDDYLQESPAR